MVMRWQKIKIEDERDTIRFYAEEIGTFKSLLEKETDEALRQWFQYFLTYAEIQLENASKRLERLRAELTDYELQQGQFQPV